MCLQEYAMSQSRKHRGYATQRILAAYLREHGFPFAEPVGAGRSGSDITGTIGIDWEIKARARFNPKETMDQLSERSGADLAIAVMRLNGQGEKSISSWVAMLTLQDLVFLLREAGYGEPSA